jgi:hypothetical protein
MRAESEIGMWESATRAPHPRLRGHVASYTGYAERTPAPLRRLAAATMTIPMIISLGPALLVDGARHRSFVAGPDDGPSVTEHAGDQLGIQVNPRRGGRASRCSTRRCSPGSPPRGRLRCSS